MCKNVGREGTASLAVISATVQKIFQENERGLEIAPPPSGARVGRAATAIVPTWLPAVVVTIVQSHLQLLLSQVTCNCRYDRPIPSAAVPSYLYVPAVPAVPTHLQLPFQLSFLISQLCELGCELRWVTALLAGQPLQLRQLCPQLLHAGPAMAEARRQ